MATEIVGIRFNVSAQTAQAQAQINALASTVDRLETKLTAMGGPKSNHRFHQTAGRLGAPEGNRPSAQHDGRHSGRSTDSYAADGESYRKD